MQGLAKALYEPNIPRNRCPMTADLSVLLKIGEFSPFFKIGEFSLSGV